MKTVRDEFKSYFRKNIVSNEFFELFIGDFIASGSFRDVFYLRHDPTKVVKFEREKRSFHNVAEYQTYHRSHKHDVREWFAPVIEISPCGVMLIQRYAADIMDSELPTEIPSFFTDCKPSNWGKIGKRIVCRDYGSTLLLESAKDAPLKKADWKLQGTKVRVP